MVYKLTDFSTLTFDSFLPLVFNPGNPDGTHVDAKFYNTFLANPLTILGSKYSGFLPEYWPMYNTSTWVPADGPGTVTVSGLNVTGTNTLFLSQFKVGSGFHLSSGSFIIDTITDNTHLTLTTSPGTISTPTSYAMLNKNVLFHIQNHYRVVALSILKKNPMTVNSLKQICNILVGKPFSILPGVCKVTTDSNYSYISVFGQQNTVPSGGSPSIVYKIPISHSLAVSTGTYVNFFDPLLSELSLFEYFKDGTSWFSSFDPTNLVPLANPNPGSTMPTDYNLNIKKVTAVLNTHSSDYGYDQKFLFKYLRDVVKKDIIFLFKEV